MSAGIFQKMIDSGRCACLYGQGPGIVAGMVREIQADGSPAVGVVVYGNRVYDDAMLELKDLLQGQGAAPIASAAYIGSILFRCRKPTAQGRPDNNDLSHAEMFGSKVREKLDAITDLAESCVNDLPGEFPYRSSTELWNEDFIAVDESCVQCGLCAEICPTGAVDTEDSSIIDIVKCITCCACLKKCPNQARTMKDGPVKAARVRLNKLFSDPKKPEFLFVDICRLYTESDRRDSPWGSRLSCVQHWIKHAF